MAETLVAESAQIAGLGNALDVIGADALAIADFVGAHCVVSPEGLGGAILEPLTTPFTHAAGVFKTRMAGIGNTTANSGDELNRTAWMYHDQDKKTYEALNAATTNLITGQGVAVDADRENTGLVMDYPDPVAYPKPNEIKLDPPSAAPPELADLIAETTGVVGDVNEAVKNVTRMAGSEVNILEMVLSRITANWNELRRIGETYKVAGNAMESSGANLEDAVRRVGPHWDGRAAIAFETWAGSQVAAMKWEGPVGRVISDMLNIVADKIRDGVRRACEKLRDFVTSFVDFRSTKQIFKALVKKIPGIGTAIEIVDMARKIWNIVDLVNTIINEIEDVRNRTKEFLEWIGNPVGKGKDWVTQKLEPITSRVDDAARRAALVNDVAKVAQAEDTLNRPKEAYEVGSGRAPWEDAV
ncbi:hypothetical protein [Nocardia fusca]|uniref:hypothetical protein n=1 Tax=Nocardia fusca TaxID=941183 RepID=UPI0007A76343|nr:hypothetical protein [Nocardia fusca]